VIFEKDINKIVPYNSKKIGIFPTFLLITFYRKKVFGSNFQEKYFRVSRNYILLIRNLYLTKNVLNLRFSTT